MPHLCDEEDGVYTRIAWLLILVTIGCGQLDESEINERSLEETVKAADEYVSTNAREYTLTASAQALFPSNYRSMSEEEKVQALDRAMDRRLNQIARSVKSHIRTVLAPFNDGETGEKAAYFTYFRRNHSRSADYVAPTGEDRFEFEFELELEFDT